ncbi:Uma2 family endonuclease [sulfur-oxidizing endosymbiont of Gigantopelta aegis]|uniref:Uma2 family endonuclease n=1 Tax=sulfur-oxidizing endosymbiont of Gigantopelta aegis TaxID=2794934 RepID=UPI0018DDD824|nr:Uma2 family endonuclease [sulfur-oxidizing endosymbiont of Gigantopelta aegis]
MSILNYLVHYTYEDYKLWDGKWELFEGFPIAMSPAPTITHQAIANLIAYQLTDTIGNCNRCLVLGEEDYKLSDDTVLRPDVALICDEPHDAYITKAPEIIVEIISKSTAKNDEGYKFDKYQAEKVMYYIIIYPNELYAKVYKLINGKYDKQGDFSTQSYNFDNTLCQASIDFDKVFQRFR